MEVKIYNGWSHSDKAEEKQAINKEIYNKLKSFAKQVGYNWRTGKPDWTKDDEENYFCYKLIRREAGRIYFSVVSNPHGFTVDEMALICDSGNLCFGYTYCGDIIIYTD